MAKAKDINKIKTICFLIVNIALSVITMALVFTLSGKAALNDQEGTAVFLGLSILSMVLYQIFLLIKFPNPKDRIRVSIIGAIYVVAAILAFGARKDYRFFFASTFAVVLAVAASQILSIFFHNKEKTRAGIFTNALAGLVFLALAISILFNIFEQDAIYITVVDSILLLFLAIKNVLLPSLKFSKVKIFLDILLKTHTFDVLLCLIAIVIGFSFLFPMFEDSISNYWDAMWYCFAVITTIGFGDFAATTLIGRVLTVILGIYGIIIVAILTSAIVNYYGAVTKKEKEEDKYIE